MIDVNLMGRQGSEMKWTGMGHFKSDNHEVYYCGQDAQETEQCGFHMYRRNTKMCYGIQPCRPNSDRIATIGPTPAMQASKHDCLASIRSNIYSGRRRN